MNRRQFIKSASITPFAAVPTTATANERFSLNQVAKDYFTALPSTTSERRSQVVTCADEVCQTTNLISKDTLEEVVETGSSASNILRRLRFAVKVLNDTSITTAVSPSMLGAAEQDVGQYTRYVPLIGSFNNFRMAACAVNQEKPETLNEFLFASAAFGLEVALWTVGAPYRMAWRGTRFISNRTLLRFANRGCSSCIALIMSELHWAIRGTLYANVEEDKIEFVWQQINELNQYATKVEGGDYKIDLTRADVVDILDGAGGGVGVAPIAREQDRGLSRWLPDIEFPDFEITFGSLLVAALALARRS